MSHPSMTPAERFASLASALHGEDGVSAPSDEPGTRRGFGAAELKVYGKIFAILSGSRLVVKLPTARVDILIAAGEGERFDPRHDGRLMKQWLVLAPGLEAQWLPLAREALAFVRGPR